MILAVETSSGESIPSWFSRTDSKSLLHILGAARSEDRRDPVVRFLAATGGSLNGLTTIVGAEEEPLDSFMARDPTDERREYWYREHAQREAAWQDPRKLTEEIDRLLALLEAPSPALSELSVSDEYFSEGLFVQDIRDLRAMLAWAAGHGIPKVRLVIIP